MIGDKWPMHRRHLVLAAALSLLPVIATANSGGGDKKKGGNASYIQIGGVSATILRRDGRRGVLTVECGLDVADTALRGRAEASQPRLRAAYAAFIQAYAAGLPTAGVPDADYIARELQAATDRVLGRPGARLLLGTILVN